MTISLCLDVSRLPEFDSKYAAALQTPQVEKLPVKKCI
jgi:hypothetical protein